MNINTLSVVKIQWFYDSEVEEIPQIKLIKTNYVKGLIVQPFLLCKELVETKFQEYITNSKKENLSDEKHVCNFISFFEIDRIWEISFFMDVNII
jgi:hypothetical protein